MPEFCEDVEDWTGCSICPRHNTQHPCWAEKVRYWRENSPLQLGASATISRRSNSSRTNAPPREPYGGRDQAVPTDERGLPFLGANLEPLTNKQIDNGGRSNFERKRRELANGQLKSNTFNA